MTGTCPPLKSPHESEGEGDKMSHRNTSLILSCFLVRLLLSTGNQARDESACISSMGVGTSVRPQECRFSCQKRGESERSEEQSDKVDIC